MRLHEGASKLVLRFDKQPEKYGEVDNAPGDNGIVDESDKVPDTGPASVYIVADIGQAISAEIDQKEKGNIAVAGLGERRDNALIVFKTGQANDPATKTASRQGKVVQTCVGGKVAPVGG